ncbi:hypothetical protein AB0L25_17240 [Spirillospora sp. NPDC052242]
MWNLDDWARYLNIRFQMWLSSSQAPTEPGYVWKKTADKMLERSWDRNQKSGWNTFPDPQWYSAPGYFKLAAELGYAAWEAWLETPPGNRYDVKRWVKRVEELQGKLDEARERGDAAEVAKLEERLTKADNALEKVKETEKNLWPGLKELENGNGEAGQEGQGENGEQGGMEGEGEQGGAEGHEGQGGQAGAEEQGGQGGQSSPNRIGDVQPIELPNPLNPPVVAPRPEDPRQGEPQPDEPRPEETRPEFPQRDLPRPEVPQREEPVNPPVQPDSPGSPGAPGGPGVPEQPEVPSLPGDPTPPETPRTPEGPGLPADPEPNPPGDPEPPETPGTPEGPGLPGDPEPNLPGEPETPGTPETPEGPGDEPGENPEDEPFRVPPLFPAVRSGPTAPGTPMPQEQPRVRPTPTRPTSPDAPGRVLERPRTTAPVGPSGGRSENSRPSDTRPGGGRSSDTRPGGGDPGSSRPGNGRGGGGGPVRTLPAPVTGGPVRTLPAPATSANPAAPPQPGAGRPTLPTGPGAGTAPDTARPSPGNPKPGPAPEWDETGPIIKRETPVPDRPQQPLQPKPQAPTFTPEKVPSVAGKSPLRGRNLAAEIATLGLEELYGRMLAENLNWTAEKIAEDPDFARRFAEEYDRYQDLSWVERRKRDFGQFLGFGSEQFLEDYFVPELRELAEAVLNPPAAQETTPPAPNDDKTKLGVMTPENGGNARTTTALYRYKVGEEGENLDLLLREEPRRAPAPAPAEEPDREEEKEDDDGPSRHEKNMEMIEEGREYRRERDAKENSGNERPKNHDGGHGMGDGGGGAPAPGAPAPSAPAPSAPPSGGSSNTIEGGGSGGAPGQGGGPAPAPAPPNSQGNANSDPARSMNKHDDPSIKA